MLVPCMHQRMRQRKLRTLLLLVLVSIFLFTRCWPCNTSSDAKTQHVSSVQEPLTVHSQDDSGHSGPVLKKEVRSARHFCEARTFKAWESEVVTVVHPVVERNCTKILAGDQEEIRTVRNKNLKWKNSLTDEELLEMTKNCSWVRGYFYDNMYVTKLERSFPIAYTLVVHNSPQQVLRLLKFLYRPTNTYCIHPDEKSKPVFSSIFQNIASCLKDNILIPAELTDIHWGSSSILDAQMNCLIELVDLRSHQSEQKQWNYVINLCGKELPLISTNGIASHLTQLNGTSVIRAAKANDKRTMKRLHKKKIPYNLTLYKSSTYVALSYRFANFLLTNTTAIRVRQFFQRCSNPEEHYYATVFMIPGVPGGFNPNLPESLHGTSIVKALWLFSKSSNNSPCAGEKVHHICIVTVSELKGVMEVEAAEVAGGGGAFFHNKYFMEQDHTIMDCMEERLVATNRREFKQECIDT